MTQANENAVEKLFDESKRQIESRGRCNQSLRCYYCGMADFKAEPCKCGSELFCGGHRACPSCQTAHREVGRFIRNLLATRVADRSNSKRGRLLDQLQEAAAELAKTDSLPAHRRFAKRVSRIAPYFPDYLFVEDLRGAFAGVLVTSKFANALDASLNRSLVAIMVMHGLLKQ